MHQFLINAHRFQRTVQYLAQGLLGDVFYPRLQVAVVLVQNGVNLPENHLVLVFSQWGNSTLVDALAAVRNDLVDIYLVDVSQAFTTRTGALRRVKRKRVRCWVIVRYACRRTHQSFRKMPHLARVVVHNHNQPFALLHGRLDGLFQTVGRLGRAVRFVWLGRDFQSVNHHLDVVVLVSVHLHALGQLHDVAVHTHMQIALSTHRLEQLPVVALTALHQRRQHQNLAALVVVQNHVDNLLLRVFHHRLAGHVAVRPAGTGKQ